MSTRWLEGGWGTFLQITGGLEGDPSFKPRHQKSLRVLFRCQISESYPSCICFKRRTNGESAVASFGKLYEPLLGAMNHALSLRPVCLVQEPLQLEMEMSMNSTAM